MKLKDFEEKFNDVLNEKTIKSWNFTKQFEQINLNIYRNIDILNNLKDESINLTDEFRFLIDAVPQCFWIDNNYFGHYNGKFFKVNLVNNSVLIIEMLKEEPKIKYIFDWSSNSGNFELEIKLGESINLMKSAISDYIDKRMYDKLKYIVEKEVKIPENEIYDHSLSVTKEDSKRIDNWMKEHLKICPTSKRYRGAIGGGQFEMKMGFTSIGSYLEYYCCDCRKKTDEIDKQNNKQEWKDSYEKDHLDVWEL